MLSHKIYSNELYARHQANASSESVSIPNGAKTLGLCSSSPEATGLRVTNIMESHETNHQSKVNCSPETDGRWTLSILMPIYLLFILFLWKLKEKAKSNTLAKYV